MKPRPVDDAVSMAVVGVIVPDEPRFHGAAFNRAAQMFQVELLRGMERAGLPATAVFSVEPIPGFPRSRRLFGKRGDETTASGLRVRLLPFVNVLALKSLTVGASVLLALLAWAWRHRHRERIIHVFNLTMPPGIAVWLAARLSGSRITVSVMDVWRPGAIVPDTLPWRVDFLVQRFDLDIGLEVDAEVLVRLPPVALAHAILRHHDDRRLHRGEARQQQVQQDERIRVEGLVCEQDAVDHDPDHQHDEEPDNERSRPADQGHALGDALAPGRGRRELTLAVLGQR